MSEKIKKLLSGQGGNYIFPFFWQHGEDEAVLREYMKVIDESNIKAVCVESRPHPDYCGPKWWQDMDVILEEAKKRNMKVWILDDSHFPTGYANGAMEKKPGAPRRQSICCRTYPCAGGERISLDEETLGQAAPFVPTKMETIIAEANGRDPAPKPEFDDDRLLCVCAARMGQGKDGRVDAKDWLNLMPCIREGKLDWEAPEGNWKVYVLHVTKNRGYYRNYINMLDRESCRVLIDAVYEPHWEHYKEKFGTVIAGFFSDEPELGNGHLYEQQNMLGTSPDADYPWSTELEEALKVSMGNMFPQYLAFLWENDADPDVTAKVRYTYMDQVSRLVEKDFSFQIGDWCREHGVEYIGHLIEDNNQHARTGSSLGHFFRGLAGQDMAGIDDIGGQVLPQGEGDIDDGNPFQKRDGEFYHYMLGKLGSSAAAVEPLKKGNSMCEIFGAYGWAEGVRLEKYLVDHFMVRGINHFVPHAFSPKEFPDPDCPPHFYAHGHNPQYRHFGKLMAYTNRVCELISGGRHVAPAAVLYHGEGEWTGSCMLSQKAGHVLTDAQIEYDYVPQDVFAEPKRYRTQIKEGSLQVNTQEYKVLVVPETRYITAAFAQAVIRMREMKIPVFFINRHPEGICDKADPMLPAEVRECPVVSLEELAGAVRKAGGAELTLMPSDDRVRYYHYIHEDGSSVYLFVNEGTKVYEGKVLLPEHCQAYVYDAWENRVYGTEKRVDGTGLHGSTAFALKNVEEQNGTGSNGMWKTGTKYAVRIEPWKSLILVFDENGEALPERGELPYSTDGMEEICLKEDWTRSICESIDYPDFSGEKKISLPDLLAEEMPEFSGFVRYATTFCASEGEKLLLKIEDAHEGVEVFVNGTSLGIEIAPPFLYDLSGAVKEGENRLVIEVATTLERAMAGQPNYMGVKVEPSALSGITGEVWMYRK